MGALQNLKLRLSECLLAVALAVAGGFFYGRAVGEAPLRYLIEMPPSDGVTQGMGIYLMPRFGVVASKLDQNRVHFLVVPDPHTTLALTKFPKLSAPPPSSTTTTTVPPPEEVPHVKAK
jgi:hypothetical protein